jgi:hypothetical protein
MLLCGRTVCTKQSFDQIHNSKIRLKCDSIKILTFHFILFIYFFFFTILFNYVAGFSFSFVMFHFDPLSGHGKRNICRTNINSVLLTLGQFMCSLVFGLTT